jgi:hypothetical protein
MGGYYEVRSTGPGREHFRLFCRLENGTQSELARPQKRINELLGYEDPSPRRRWRRQST